MTGLTERLVAAALGISRLAVEELSAMLQRRRGYRRAVERCDGCERVTLVLGFVPAVKCARCSWPIGDDDAFVTDDEDLLHCHCWRILKTNAQIARSHQMKDQSWELVERSVARLPRPRILDGVTILLIDDDHETVDMLRQSLHAAGAMVLVAGSARAGLVLTQTHVIHAPLVNFRLPGEDGRWFLWSLRASGTPDAATIPVLVMSGEPPDPDRPPSGFIGHFLKPIDGDDVVETFARLLHRTSIGTSAEVDDARE
jgi:CheY-like chemotaxis protein